VHLINQSADFYDKKSANKKPRDLAGSLPVVSGSSHLSPNLQESKGLINDPPFSTIPNDSQHRASDLANFQLSRPLGHASPENGSDAEVGGPSLTPVVEAGRVNVIYARFSSELQRDDSITDQERRCRDHLARMGFDPRAFCLVADEAISGTVDSRPGFDRVKSLVHSNRLGTLISTELSRISQGDNTKSFLKDIVFHGGRYISVSENIDTTRRGWRLTAGFSEMHHSQVNEETADRVRGGQGGRKLDRNGSAGDFPYGYGSEYVDPQAALAYHGRGPKPRKRVVIVVMSRRALLIVVVLLVFVEFLGCLPRAGGAL